MNPRKIIAKWSSCLRRWVRENAGLFLPDSFFLRFSSDDRTGEEIESEIKNAIILVFLSELLTLRKIIDWGQICPH